MILAIVLPPEIIDGLIALGSALIGWLVRKLQGRAALKAAKKEAEIYRTYIENDMNARVRPPMGFGKANVRRNDVSASHISKTHINQAKRHGKE